MAICPLLAVAFQHETVHGTPKRASECYKKTCSWYIEKDERDPTTQELKGDCAIVILAHRALRP